jgi:hypothetical protein
VISEKKFAEKFTSFWSDILPRGSAVSRYINLQVERFAKPVRSTIPGRRRALVNEIGFRLFVEGLKDGEVMAKRIDPDRIIEIGREVDQFLNKGLAPSGEDDVGIPSGEEIEEATILAHRISRYFLIYESKIKVIPEPYFAGCGILDSCRGDILAGSTLYEVKSAEGGFRLADLRQVLAYCALNHAQPLHAISSVGFINPRLGVFFTSDVEALVRSAAGMPADSFFFDTTHFLASQSASP